MAGMTQPRLVLLSTVTFIRTLLNEAGFTAVSIIDSFPDDNKIVLPGFATGTQGEVVLPALAIKALDVMDGRRLGIGEGAVENDVVVAMFLHALGGGQEIDIRETIRAALADTVATLYDYSTTGYPSTAAKQSGSIEFLKIRSFPVDYGSEVLALRHAGMITCLARTVRTSI
jgi:hypothetical protein